MTELEKLIVENEALKSTIVRIEMFARFSPKEPAEKVLPIIKMQALTRAEEIAKGGKKDD